jgi:putative DNA primase/helicase
MDALRAELPGILAWAVRGALRWQKDGMQTPPEVVVAVNEYKAEQDPLIDFFDECVFISSELAISKGDLYAVYESWSRTGRPMSKVAFSKRMAAKGFKEVRRNLQRSWEGIGLTTQGAFLSSSTHYNNG